MKQNGCTQSCCRTAGGLHTQGSRLHRGLLNIPPLLQSESTFYLEADYYTAIVVGTDGLKAESHRQDNRWTKTLFAVVGCLDSPWRELRVEPLMEPVQFLGGFMGTSNSKETLETPQDPPGGAGQQLVAIFTSSSHQKYTQVAINITWHICSSLLNIFQYNVRYVYRYGRNLLSSGNSLQHQLTLA